MITFLVLTLLSSLALHLGFEALELLFNRPWSTGGVNQRVGEQHIHHTRVLQPAGVWGRKRDDEIVNESDATKRRDNELKNGLKDEE